MNKHISNAAIKYLVRNRMKNTMGSFNPIQPDAMDLSNLLKDITALKINVTDQNPIDFRKSFDYTYVDNFKAYFLLILNFNSLQTPFVFIDIEHYANSNYMGKISLVQLSYVKDSRIHTYVLDFIKIPYYVNFFLSYLLSSNKYYKVFHGSTHDIHWLKRDLNIDVVNLIDTQVLSKEMDLQVADYSLHALWGALNVQLHTDITKDHKRTLQASDWLQRPLTAEQLEYAAIDTFYLVHCLYEMATLLSLSNKECHDSIIDKTSQLNANYRDYHFTLSIFNLDNYTDKNQSYIDNYLNVKDHNVKTILSLRYILLHFYTEHVSIMYDIPFKNNKLVLKNILIQNFKKEYKYFESELTESDKSLENYEVDAKSLGKYLDSLIKNNILEIMTETHQFLYNHSNVYQQLYIEYNFNFNFNFIKENSSDCQEVDLIDLVYSTQPIKLVKEVINTVQKLRLKLQDHKEERRQKMHKMYAIKKPIYQNYRMLAPDGEFLCYTDHQKCNWYVAKGIAKMVDDPPRTFKLVFEPSGRTSDLEEGVREFYTGNKANLCVRCGSVENLCRFSVVPQLYKGHMPPRFKAHRAHDIVLLCMGCHDVANKLYEIKKREIAAEYEQPLNKLNSESISKLEIKKMIKFLGILRDKDNIGDESKYKIYTQIINSYNKIDENSKNEIISVLKLKWGKEKSEDENNEDHEDKTDSDNNMFEFDYNSVDEIKQIREILQKVLLQFDKCGQKSEHGKQVVDVLMEDSSDLKVQEFIKSWRAYFKDKLEPKHMSPWWDVNHYFERNYGEYSIFNNQNNK